MKRRSGASLKSSDFSRASQRGNSRPRIRARTCSRVLRAVVARKDPVAVRSPAMKKWLVPLVVLVCGCATKPTPHTPFRYSNPGSTQEQFMRDRTQCLQYASETSNSVTPNCGIWISCLAGRGYVLDPNGDLMPPPGMRVNCER
jgi:hypothetical protein